MVERIINLLNKEFGGLHQAAFLLALSSFASQILALLRDRLLAGSLGASRELDIYYSAFRVPDLLFATVGSFLSITVIIPILIDKLSTTGRDKDDRHGVTEFLSDMLSAFLLGFFVLACALFFLIPFLTKFIVPGFDASAQDVFINLTRVLLLSPMIFGISSLLSCITQSFRRFFVYALSPIMYNLGIILGVLFLYPRFGLPGLIYGVIFGAILHLVVQLPVIFKIGILPMIKGNINYAEVKKVASKSLPRTVALGFSQLSIMALISLASLMRSGSISIFNLSYNLQSIPLAIVGVSYSVAALPNMSRIFSRETVKDFVAYVEIAIKHIIFWSLPASILFIVLRAQIVRVVLGSGQFDWTSTRLAAASLAIFAISVVAQSLINFLSMVYYSAGLTKKPVITRVIGSILIIVLSFIFVKAFDSYTFVVYFLESLLRVDFIDGTSVLVLPLAFSIGTIINVMMFIRDFRRDFGKFSGEISRSFFQSLAGSIITGFVAYQFLRFFASLYVIDTFVEIFAQGLLAGVFGIIAGGMVLILLGNQEIKTVLQVARQKFWKAQTIIPTPEEL